MHRENGSRLQLVHMKDDLLIQVVQLKEKKADKGPDWKLSICTLPMQPIVHHIHARFSRSDAQGR